MNNRLRVAAISRHSADVDACFCPIKCPSQRDEAGRVALILVAEAFLLHIVEKGGHLCCSRRDGCAAEPSWPPIQHS